MPEFDRARATPAPRANASRCFGLVRVVPEFRALLMAECPRCQGCGDVCVVAYLRCQVSQEDENADDDIEITTADDEPFD